MNTFSKLLRAGAVTAALVLSVGCASTSDIDALRAEVDQANATANRAAADAAAARAAAEAASATASETNEKLDRMFKKSMYK